MKSVYVLNARGEREPFSYQKVVRSAKRAGASKDLAEKIGKDIEKGAYSGMTTFEIFQQVKKGLRQSPQAALKFNLRKAMEKLGPTGFPFEKFIARIFEELGFTVELNKEVQGKCIVHEIDFLAQKGKVLKIGECKYRNQKQNKVHVEDILKNYAVFLDLKFNNAGSLVVTNTKFTTRAIKYANCNNIELLGWKYPRTMGLERIIDKYQLYPITILPSLNKLLAEIFASHGLMLAKDALRVDNLVKNSKMEKEKLAEEAEILFGRR